VSFSKLVTLNNEPFRLSPIAFSFISQLSSVLKRPSFPVQLLTDYVQLHHISFISFNFLLLFEDKYQSYQFVFCSAHSLV
jgi:hypothetical protein